MDTTSSILYRTLYGVIRSPNAQTGAVEVPVEIHLVSLSPLPPVLLGAGAWEQIPKVALGSHVGKHPRRYQVRTILDPARSIRCVEERRQKLLIMRASRWDWLPGQARYTQLGNCTE